MANMKREALVDCFGGEDAGFILRCSVRLDAKQRERIKAGFEDWCSRRPRPVLVVGPEMTVHILAPRSAEPDKYTI
jgi:hypothetical protein